jgi:hypothetical protein
MGFGRPFLGAAGLQEAIGASRGVVFRGVREEGVGEEEVLDRVVRERGRGSRMAEMVRV